MLIFGFAFLAAFNQAQVSYAQNKEFKENIDGGSQDDGRQDEQGDSQKHSYLDLDRHERDIFKRTQGQTKTQTQDRWTVLTFYARQYMNMGMHEMAENLYLEAIEVGQGAFEKGDRDPHIGATYHNLAETYRIQKKYDQAKPLYEKSLGILEEAFTYKDPRYAQALQNYGIFHLTQNQTSQAEKLLRRAVEIKKEVLGVQNTDYSITLLDLAACLRKAQKLEEAITISREAKQQLFENLPGGSTDEALCVTRYIQLLYENTKNLRSDQQKRSYEREAEQALDRLYEMEAMLPEDEATRTSLLIAQLSKQLASKGRITLARQLLQRNIDVMEKRFKGVHTIVIVLYRVSSAIELQYGLSAGPQKAIEQARKAANVSKTLYDKQIRLHSQTFITKGLSMLFMRSAYQAPSQRNLLMSALEYCRSLQCLSQAYRQANDIQMALDTLSQCEMILNKEILHQDKSMEEVSNQISEASEYDSEGKDADEVDEHQQSLQTLRNSQVQMAMQERARLKELAHVLLSTQDILVHIGRSNEAEDLKEQIEQLQSREQQLFLNVQPKLLKQKP